MGKKPRAIFGRCWWIFWWVFWWLSPLPRESFGSPFTAFSRLFERLHVGSFGAAVMAVCARHAPERQEPRTASKRPVPVERATVLPCSLALHNPPIADTACFLNPCAGLEQQHSPEAVARMSRAVVKRQQAQDSRGRAEAASMAAGEPPAQWRSSVEDRPHAHAALRRHGIPEVRSSARRRVHSLNPYACPIGRSHAPRP